MNTRQRKTLQNIFQKPARSDILWKEVISLMKALGAEVVESSGSRVRFVLNDTALVFHSPHPQKEIGKPTVKGLQEFLEHAGVEP